jgi:hypothetical protein
MWLVDEDGEILPALDTNWSDVLFLNVKVSVHIMLLSLCIFHACLPSIEVLLRAPAPLLYVSTAVQASERRLELLSLSCEVGGVARVAKKLRGAFFFLLLSTFGGIWGGGLF